MIDIVYALGSGSIWDDNELRYSLRSIEKHVASYGKIYIVGEYPHWLQHAIHIPCEDKYGHERNIMEKIKVACNTDVISENFFFINDDHFLLKDCDISNYPHYNRGSLAESIAKRVQYNDVYKEAMINTLEVLQHFGHSRNNFDVHTPIVYNKKKFIDIMALYNWEEHEFIIKSLYCNSAGITGPIIDDCKLHGRIAKWRLPEKLKGHTLFSISDRSLNPYPGDSESSVIELLKKLFPNKSKYEL